MSEKELREVANMILYQLCKRGLISLTGNAKTLTEVDTVRNEARQVVYEGLLRATQR